MDSAPVLPRAPEPEFGHGLRAALLLAPGARARKHASEPISPELAMICPELRLRALEALPERDPDTFAPVRPGIESTLEVYRQHIWDAEGLEIEPPQTPVHARAKAFLAVEAARTAVAGVAVMTGLAAMITLAQLHL